MKLLVIIVGAAFSAGAQSLPRWTVELTTGAGAHTVRTGNEWYFDGAEALGRIAIAGRVFGTERLAAHVKLDYVTDASTGEKASCTVTPTGSCYGSFRFGRGSSVAIGLRQMIVGPLMIGAAVGMGDYGNSSVGERHRSYVEGEFALQAFSHLAVMASARYLRWSTAGTTYWFAPVMVGLQLR